MWQKWTNNVKDHAPKHYQFSALLSKKSRRIHGSRRSMQSYILTYSMLNRGNRDSSGCSTGKSYFLDPHFPVAGRQTELEQMLECFMDTNTENTWGAWDRQQNVLWTWTLKIPEGLETDSRMFYGHEHWKYRRGLRQGQEYLTDWFHIVIGNTCSNYVQNFAHSICSQLHFRRVSTRSVTFPFSVLNWVGQRNCLYHVTGWHSKSEDHKGKGDFKQKQHKKTPCTDVVALAGIVAFLTKVVLWCDR